MDMPVSDPAAYSKARLILTLRAAGVTDTAVVSVMEQIPREMFVPEFFLDQAYDDVTLPIGHHQTLSQPGIVGIMTEALRLTDRHKVLEVGTGSGYQTAVLSRLARRVYTIERHGPLMEEAEARLEELRVRNVTTQIGDGTLGWPEQAPFDRIIVTAAAADIPPVLAGQLREGGVMLVPVASDIENQAIVRVTRIAEGFETEEIRTVKFVPLIPEEGAA